MSGDNFLHSITDGFSEQNEISSSITPETIKTTFNIRKSCNVPIKKENEYYTCNFSGSIAEGILKIFIEIELPELNCKKDYFISWKKNICLEIIRHLWLYQENTPISELQESELALAKHLMIIDSHYPLAKNCQNHYPEKLSRKLNAKKLIFDVPFSFFNRPSTFLQTFRCPNKNFTLKMRMNTNISKLLEIFNNEKKRIDFNSDVIESYDDKFINISNCRFEVLQHISKEDKKVLLSTRNIEIVDVFETTKHPISEKTIIPIYYGRKNNVKYHSFFWEIPSGKTLQKTSFEDSKNDFIFQNVEPIYTNSIWPAERFRRIPFENENLHVWSNCLYYCDMGAKPARSFDITARFILEFSEDEQESFVSFIRGGQMVYLWKGDVLECKV